MSSHEIPQRRLSALIVNHDSGSWALRCVESLKLEWERDGRAPGDLEVIVLDSGSNEAESTWWRSLRRIGARVKSSPANVGYAMGLNMAWEMSSGEPDDIVALLNPDLCFLPGSLRPLLERLEECPEVGMVAPRLFLDEERALRLPQNLLPTPMRELGEWLAARSPRLARWRAARCSASAREFWTEQSPARMEMLSGACLFLRRETVTNLGTPMDGRFPLYFEDADLCARLSARGKGLELIPAAEVLHHWSRSAGPDFQGEVARRHGLSQRLWMQVHHGGVLARSLRGLKGLLQRHIGDRFIAPMHPLVDLGEVSESPEVRFAGEGSYVLELSLTSFWGLSAGVLVEGSNYSLPARSWSWLFPGTYYMRALDADTGRFLGAWRFCKLSAARSWPIDPGDLPEINRRARSPRLGERVG